jgi:acetylornithine deacetylase/succinyl-diaminopimelate desuccinylase-like protein
VAVSKSDFASYTWALLALKAAVTQGGKLAGTLELHFTYDEEAGGNVGPKWLLDQGLVKPDAVIAAGFSYSVVTAHNGCLHLEVTVTGKQAHAAMPEAGVDALEAMPFSPRFMPIGRRSRAYARARQASSRRR